MKLISDLHFHSKYSRAVSQQMILPEIAEWARIKGIDLITTADFTHPVWFREIKAGLEEVGGGIYQLRGEKLEAGSPYRVNGRKPKFILTTEISCIFSQGGKGRRIHLVVMAPSISEAEKINSALGKRGNLLSDGRPILGMSARDLTVLVLETSPEALIIPAHCLLPETYLHTKNGVTRIDEIQEKDLVYTHKGRLQKVTSVLKRNYHGKIYHVKLFYFPLGIKTTEEHPFYAIKTKKKCKSTNGFCKSSCSDKKFCRKKDYLKYKPEWILAKDLENSDVLLYPRIKQIRDNKFSEDYYRLIGYYLAEGYTDNRDSIGFCFSEKETDYIEDVKYLMKEVFKLDYCREYQRKNTKGKELTFFSKNLSNEFGRFFYSSKTERKTFTKCLPSWMLFLPLNKQKEIIKGWWRGDDGYTSSRLLMNQMKIILLRLGIIPSIRIDSIQDHLRRGNHQLGKRTITAQHDSYYFSNLSFFEDKFNLLSEKEFEKFKTKMERKHGWMDKNYIYIPIREIQTEDYKGDVYNLEVEKDNSYLTEFTAVHNCWTPWFSLYGSESGFDSINECFGDMAKNIFAVETGLSSSPEMNWRIGELDNRSIISNSDAHSGAKLGREATVFEIGDTKELTYQIIRKAIVNQRAEEQFSDNRSLNQISRSTDILPHISHTLEFYPEEGKYHYTGHRNCNIRQSPEETKTKGEICPVCGKGLTVGVMHRVEQLATREITTNNIQQRIDEYGVKWIGYENRPPYAMLVPLLEILAESLESTTFSQKTLIEYKKLTENFGGEFNVLLQTKPEEIEKLSGERVAEGIKKVRSGNIVVEPGYDGVFGVVKIWGQEGDVGNKGDEEKSLEQMTLL